MHHPSDEEPGENTRTVHFSKNEIVIEGIKVVIKMWCNISEYSCFCFHYQTPSVYSGAVGIFPR